MQLMKVIIFAFYSGIDFFSSLFFLVIACACIYGREFDVLRKEKDVIEKSAKQTDVTVSRLAEQYNGLFYQLKNVQANIDDAVATIEVSLTNYKSFKLMSIMYMIVSSWAGYA